MSVIFIGDFDGIHIGHVSLINAALSRARMYGEKLYAYTFDNNSKSYRCAENTVPAIMSNDDRDILLKRCGADKVISVIFNKKFSDVSADEFLEILKNKYNCHCIVCGENFRFGKNAECGRENIESYTARHNIQAVIVPLLKCDSGDTVSSSAIRSYINSGNVSKASEMLGKYFYIKGKVCHGRRDGTGIGFPTLNVMLPQGIVVPARGVYETVTLADGVLWHSMTNVGTAPTFTDEKKFVTETNIISDINGQALIDHDLYGESICIYFLNYIRQEKKYENIDSLIERLKYDREIVRDSKLFKNEKIVIV